MGYKCKLCGKDISKEVYLFQSELCDECLSELDGEYDPNSILESCCNSMGTLD